MIKQMLLPAACIFALVFCCSCENSLPDSDAPEIKETVAAPEAETPEAAEPTEDSVPAPQNGEYFTDEEIIELYEAEGYTVMNIKAYEEASALTNPQILLENPAVVQAYAKEWTQLAEDDIIPSQFTLFNRQSGERRMLHPMSLAVDFKVLSAESVLILTSGSNWYNGHQYFPEVLSCYLASDNGLQYTSVETEKYHMPIEQSFTLGVGRPECLSGIYFGLEGVSFGFSPQPGSEAAFYAAYCSIPQMNLSFTENKCIIVLEHTIFDEDFTPPAPGSGDDMIGLLSVNCDGENTTVTLAIDESISRYNVSTGGYLAYDKPYALLSFLSQEQSEDNPLYYYGF